MQDTNGFKTTFWMDFSIADRFGADAIKDAYRRAFLGLRHDYRYLTDLVVVLNHKIWQHWERGDVSTARLYNRLWSEADLWAVTHFCPKELAYFYSVTD